MFYLIRKVIIGTAILLWAGVAAYTYQHVDRFCQIYNQYEARYLLPKQREADAKEHQRIQREDERKIVSSSFVKISRINDGLTFLVYESASSSYQVGLTGVTFPRWSHIAVESKRFAGDLLTQKSVSLKFTSLSPNRTGMVIMYIGATNVNEYVIASGMAGVDYKQLEHLPSVERTNLITAAIKARDERAGMWSK